MTEKSLAFKALRDALFIFYFLHTDIAIRAKPDRMSN
jgi:hypothetical protein